MIALNCKQSKHPILRKGEMVLQSYNRNFLVNNVEGGKEMRLCKETSIATQDNTKQVSQKTK
jgi:hypothetical protein